MRTHSRRAVLGAGIAVAGSGSAGRPCRRRLQPRPALRHGRQGPCPRLPPRHPGRLRHPRRPGGRRMPRQARAPGPVRKFTLTATPARSTWAARPSTPGRTATGCPARRSGSRPATPSRSPSPTSCRETTPALARPRAAQRHGRRPRPHPAAHRRRARRFTYRFTVAAPGHVLVPPALRRAAGPRPVRAADRRGPGGAAVATTRSGSSSSTTGSTGWTAPPPTRSSPSCRKGMSGTGGGHGTTAACGHGVASDPSPVATRPVPDADGRQQRPARRRRGRCRLPALPDQRPHARRTRRVFRAKPGDRVRLRIINAGGDTAFRVALGGHRLTVTHTDGFPVGTPRPTPCCSAWASATTCWSPPRTAVFPLDRARRGQEAPALAVLRTGAAAAPARRPPGPTELDGRLLSGGPARAADESVAAGPPRPGPHDRAAS